MVIEEALDICRKHIKCEERIRNCTGPCKGCRYEYEYKDFEKALKFVIKEMEKYEKIHRD